MLEVGLSTFTYINSLNLPSGSIERYIYSAYPQFMNEDAQRPRNFPRVTRTVNGACSFTQWAALFVSVNAIQSVVLALHSSPVEKPF